MRFVPSCVFLNLVILVFHPGTGSAQALPFSVHAHQCEEDLDELGKAMEELFDCIRHAEGNPFESCWDKLRTFDVRFLDYVMNCGRVRGHQGNVCMNLKNALDYCKKRRIVPQPYRREVNGWCHDYRRLYESLECEARQS